MTTTSDRRTFKVGAATFGDGRLTVIAGPCVIESREHALIMARECAERAGAAGLDFVFKSSFDKANRSSIKSFRGLGMEAGLEILGEVRNEFGVPIIFDVTHSLQLPDGLGHATGGLSDYIEPLARAGVACGVDGVFMEVHDAPERAPSDGPNMLPLERMGNLLETLHDILAL